MTAKAYTGRDGVELAFVRSIPDLYSNSHELFTAEALVYATALVGLIHALRNKGESTLFFCIAFAAASFVDPFCLISEQIRNYFHSHASILLWDRHVAPWQFPLFACIAYVPGALVWELKLPLLAETGLVVFVSSWSFYAFDLFACRWLLYQWHVSDPLYAARTHCVPLASSMWVMTYAGTASLLARLAYRWTAQKGMKAPKAFDYEWWALFAICTLVFLPLHIVPISVFYFPSFIFNWGMEYAAVWAFGLLGLALAVSNFQMASVGKVDVIGPCLALLQSMIWFGSLVYVLLTIDPIQVVSTSVHQPYGGTGDSPLCAEKETYLFGLSQRKRYACDSDLVHWTIAADPKSRQKPKPLDEWYTIQGLKMDSDFFDHYAMSVLFAVTVHICLFVLALSRKGEKTKSA